MPTSQPSDLPPSPIQTPTTPLPVEPTASVKRSFSLMPLALVFVFICIVIFTPIPTYQGPVVCKPGIKCPEPGWYFSKSLFQNILYSRSNPSSVASVPTASPTPTLDLTTNWKMYTNQNRYYSFRYPQILTLTSKPEKEITTDTLVSAANNYSIWIFSAPIETAFPLEFNATKTAESMVTVAGQKIRRIEGKEFISDTGTLIHVGALGYKTYHYMIVYSSGSQPATTDSLTIFDQILSTFTFTPNASQISSPTIAFLPPLSLTERKSERDLITARVINPFIDFQKDMESNQTIVSITVEDNKSASSKTQFPYSFTAIFTGGPTTQMLLEKSDGKLNWYIPTCMECTLSETFRQKYPEISAQFTQ